MNHAPLLIGQLKAIAAPFYTRLHAAAPIWLEAERIANGTNHINSIFSWTSATTDDNNKAMANIGQLKAAFSLRFDGLPGGSIDIDADGMHDHWELANGLDPTNSDDATLDHDSDGLNNLAEYRAGTAPNKHDTDGDGIDDAEEIASGHDPKSNQSFPPRWVSTQRRGATWATPAYVRPDWNTNLGQVVESNSYPITVTNLVTPLESLGFPLHAPDAFPLPVGFTIPSVVAGGYRAAWGGGELSQARCWLQSKPAVSAETKRTVLRVTTEIRQPWGPEKEESSVVEALEVVIPANATQSEPIDLLPTFASLPNVEEEQQITSRLLPVDLVPDYNRDGKIDQADRGKISEENPYRFWVNDDDDRLGEKRGKNSNDIPGSRSGSSHGAIDGIRDLIDFFPLHLDLQAALKSLPSTEYKYFLKHAEGALKFHEVVETKLDKNHDNQGPSAYLKNVAKALSLDGSTLKHANLSGVELSAGILGSFEKGEGVLLCEITQQTQVPLILEIRKNDGTSIAEIKFPLKTSGVEDMYRHVNLRPAAGGSGGRATQIGEPSNYPDDIPELTSDKYLVFVHGYNVNGEQARGWHSEVFKRMWWSGSIARFVGVSWHGEESQGGAGITSPVAGLIPDHLTPNYHANVINAFQTAGDLASSLAWIDGEISIGAHSLGNMVVGLAVQDHGFQPDDYFLLDAAVAMESYNAGEAKQANMTNGDWVGYDERLWASEWHQLPWPQNDPRKKLTWRGRLGDVVSRTNAYNFYSSEEEVLNNATASQSSSFLGAVADDLVWDSIVGGNVLGEHTWALQEILKGKGITGEVLGSIYGGWKFNYKYLTWPVNDPPPAEITEIYASLYQTSSVPPLPLGMMYNTRQLHPDETTGLAGQQNQLMAKPFFDPPPAGKTHAELLAQAFPARTNPAGRNPVGIFDAPSESRNFNMATLKSGSYSADTNESRWLHSDIRDIGYLYTWKVYEKFREIGELNQ